MRQPDTRQRVRRHALRASESSRITDTSSTRSRAVCVCDFRTLWWPAGGRQRRTRTYSFVSSYLRSFDVTVGAVRLDSARRSVRLIAADLLSLSALRPTPSRGRGITQPDPHARARDRASLPDLRRRRTTSIDVSRCRRDTSSIHPPTPANRWSNRCRTVPGGLRQAAKTRLDEAVVATVREDRERWARCR